jgi:hypothetical protein
MQKTNIKFDDSSVSAMPAGESIALDHLANSVVQSETASISSIVKISNSSPPQASIRSSRFSIAAASKSSLTSITASGTCFDHQKSATSASSSSSSSLTPSSSTLASPFVFTHIALDLSELELELERYQQVEHDLEVARRHQENEFVDFC